MTDNKHALEEKLKSICSMIAIQDHEESGSLGVSFTYLDRVYTAYCNVDSGQCEVLRHDIDDITRVENIGAITVDGLVSFF